MTFLNDLRAEVANHDTHIVLSLADESVLYVYRLTIQSADAGVVSTDSAAALRLITDRADIGHWTVLLVAADHHGIHPSIVDDWLAGYGFALTPDGTYRRTPHRRER